MNNNIKKFLDESAKVNFTNIKPVNNTSSISLKDSDKIIYNLYGAYIRSKYGENISFDKFKDELKPYEVATGVDEYYYMYGGVQYSVPLR
ncbi:hypothetical protein AN278_008795 (plasmid) [Pediococcus pentosaceus]|uniref:hypothetical protein n=1 Tax=Pediococcus pentosaceus TaxID=1255 RepID=UPI0006D8A983|nr:hypothetical protein [Pediococcus pentosaceus]ANI98607.1 hypothetical protein AN278_008795 [Pediococcus pentosaceus]KQB79694.1 hypothetical protein AN278_08720 [Pediococcus pentosaceus]